MSNDVMVGELGVERRADCALTKGGEVETALAEQRPNQTAASSRWLVIILAAVCALLDFFLWPIFRRLQGPPGFDAVLYFGLVGCTLGQGNLLAAWLAWSEGPFLRRLMQHWIAALLLYFAWAMGVWIAGPPAWVTLTCVSVGLAVPLISLAAQLPLWVTRVWLGWRIVRTSEKDGVGSEEPMTIRGLMGTTLLVALALTLARMVPMIQGSQEVWGALIAGFISAAVISSVGMLPAGRLLLGLQRIGPALLWSCVYAAGLISLVWIVRELLIRYTKNAGPPVMAFCMLTGLMVGFAVTLVVAGVVARRMGYRLMWRRLAR
jgi:hypothetical protein